MDVPQFESPVPAPVPTLTLTVTVTEVTPHDARNNTLAKSEVVRTIVVHRGVLRIQEDYDAEGQRTIGLHIGGVPGPALFEGLKGSAS